MLQLQVDLADMTAFAQGFSGLEAPAPSKGPQEQSRVTVRKAGAMPKTSSSEN